MKRLKTYTLSAAEAITHRPAAPERTARKNHTGMNFDVTYQVWPSRAAMAKTIRMQEKGEPSPTHWRACVTLTPGEGY